jgi:hypothetical protein
MLTNNPYIAYYCNSEYSSNKELLLCRCVYNNSYITCPQNNQIPINDLITFKNHLRQMNGKIKSAYYTLKEHCETKIYVFRNDDYIINCIGEYLIEM